MTSESEEPRESGGDEPLVSQLGEGESGSAPAATSGGTTTSGGVASSYSPAASEPASHPESPNMLPRRERRRSLPERLLVRLIATAGIVGIGVAIAAIMVSSNSQGWVVGLVVSLVTVVLAAILWSSRVL